MNGTRWILAGLALVVGCVAASSSRAEPYELTFENPDPEPISGLEVCIGAACVDHAVECGPGERCQVEISVPWGCYRISLRTHRGGALSENVTARGFCHLDALTRYDRQANGSVSTIDFAPFFEAFRTY